MGLEDVFLKTHATSPPSTCAKSQQNFPIDSIWASAMIPISRAGFLGFDEGSPSDHRSLWFEVEQSSIFGHSVPGTQPISIRKLKTSDPRMVARYNKRVLDLFNKEGLLEKARELNQVQEDQWTVQHEKAYNDIHARSTDIRLQVEQNIRQVRHGMVPWSPKIQIYRDTIELWECVLKRKLGGKSSIDHIRSLMRKTGLKSALETTVEECRASVDKAYKEYREAKEFSPLWRDDHVDSLVDAQAEANNISRATQMKISRSRERQRRNGRAAKRARGKLGKSRVTKVFYTEEGIEQEATLRKEMEEAITSENIDRFSQTNDTPPMNPQVLQMVGDIGQNSIMESILDGGPVWDSMPVSKQAKELFQQLKRPSGVTKEPISDFTITTEDHCQAWRKFKETTASEPSAPSFSHFKAAVSSPELAEFDAAMRSMPYTHGFSPLLWRIITDVSILKKEGLYNVNKMRTIHK